MTQRRLAQKILKHNWSVRETEQKVKQLQQPKAPAAAKQTPTLDPNIRAAEVKLRRLLSTQVRIQPQRPGSPGRIEIEYYNLADLDRIFSAIVRGGEEIARSHSTSSN
jgi:ParB-like chromosome segregation protein Spo0J